MRLGELCFLLGDPLLNYTPISRLLYFTMVRFFGGEVSEQVELVQDNLNTHTYGAFYDHLPAEKARALTQKPNFHFTPKHGRWLNMAEIEFSVLARKCLRRRIGSLEKLEKEVLHWSESRNAKSARIHWSFTVDTARYKLASQYEKVNEANASYKN